MTALTLGVALTLTFVIVGLVTPILASLCALAVIAFDVEVPGVTEVVMALSPWWPVAGAVMIAVLLVVKDRWVAQRAALWINVTSAILVVFLGGFAVLCVIAPIFALMKSLAG